MFGCSRVLKLRAAGWSYADLRKQKVPEDVIKRVQTLESGIVQNNYEMYLSRAVSVHQNILNNYKKNPQVV